MTAIAWLLFDLVLAGMLIGLAAAALASNDLKRGIVLFIAFGLLMALVWARLNAPDLALAEAAIGAGLSGVLLLTALRDDNSGSTDAGLARSAAATLVSVLCIAMTGVIGWAMLHALTNSVPLRLAVEVADELGNSGVSNPVTAVLLNFRAYDTLLELAVLLAAVLGILATGYVRPAYRQAGELLAGLVGWLVPLFIVVAGYLLWVGAHAPGGAFQAGAMLAAAAVLLRLGGRGDAGLPAVALQRWMLVAGIGVFAITGLVVSAGGQAFLQYPAGWSGALILLIESAAMLSIAVTLAVAFIGGPVPGQDSATGMPTRACEKKP